ncbi:BglG family transcription antiterminator [Clostridium sp. DL1XJH146]
MDRLMKITMLILKSKAPITTAKIASELNVSNKTIRNDLNKLQDIIEREGLKLNKKTGVGNSIEGPDKNKNQLLQSLNKEVDGVEPFSKEGRQNYILKRLFMGNQNITASKLADELFVCVATINKDLKYVKEKITDFDLELVKKSNHSLDIVGTEKNYRNAIASLIFQSSEEIQHVPITKYEYTSRIDQSTMNQLRTLMNLDYLKLEECLNNLERKLSFKFSQEAYICLIIHIAIAIKRIKSGKDVLLSSEILDKLKRTKEFKGANEISEEIERNFNIKIPEQEIGYITLHIIGTKIGEKDLAELTFSMGNQDEVDLEVEIANNIIQVASDALHMNLKEDKILLNGLILHLRPTINRLKYGLTLRNPILEEIKINYPDIFGIAWITSRVFEKYLDVKVPEAEIGYIAMHLGASIERNRKRIKILVVCHSGIGTSQLLSARLERSFKELEIIGITSSVNLFDEKYQKAEIIISTIPLKTNKPVLIISPLFTKVDINKVQRMIDIFEAKKNTKNPKEIIAKEVFSRSKKFSNRNELINDICKSLEKRQYIYKGFKDDVIERENIMATEVGQGIVIPHGKPSEVEKSCVSLTILKKPILWDKEKVEFIFMICLTEKDLKYARKFFKNLSDNMDDTEFIHNLRKGTDKAHTILEGMLNNLES